MWICQTPVSETENLNREVFEVKPFAKKITIRLKKKLAKLETLILLLSFCFILGK